MDDDTCPQNRERFVDIDKCLGLIGDIRTISIASNESENFKQQSDSEKLVETFRKTIDPYQEQPELLDPYLADLIQKLLEELNQDNISELAYHTTFKFLYQLIKVTGFKHVAKKFPHETDKLTLLINLLDKENPEDRSNWQTRFVLLVWLSIVILTPFDLSKFDSGSTETSISDRIHGVLLKSLDIHDSCQHVAAFCLAKFFSRPDILKSASQFVDRFTEDALLELTNVKTGLVGSMDDIKLIGRLRALGYMFKFLPREEMNKRSCNILDVISRLELDKVNRELVNHLIIKLAQRAGLALLPKSVSTWRYKRGSRILGSLTDEIIRCKEAEADETRSATGSLPASSGQSAAQGGAPVNQGSDLLRASRSNYDEPELEPHADEYLESLLSILFVAAQNSQTKIRWSAAKGIARIASRLNRDRASDVIDMVLQNFFNDTSSDFAWHGGCLTLAEMSRNGLILKEKLADVINVVANAILYDKIKGASAVGTHVRESACYVCWAMARSYEDKLLAPYISNISLKLLCTMLFDRELQCRRAASATFQELVGRQGTFNEEGINILTHVDYQNVGQRQFAYLHLAMQVASYGPNYSEPFAEHLIEKKICHWDVKLRRLACDSLASLMLHLNEEFVRTKVLPRLIEMGGQQQNQDTANNNAKHGALLGLAKVIGGLAPLQFEYPEGLIEFVGGIVKVCEKQLKNKQQGPNFMEAIGCMISSAELANFYYADDSETLKQWESTALSALNSDDGSLREIGGQALLTLYRTYYKQNKTSQDRLLTFLNKSLQSANESSRCGALLALSKLSQALSDCSTTTTATTSIGGLSSGGGNKKFVDDEQAAAASPPRTDADTPDIILMSLASYIGQDTHERSRGFVFAQAKACACEAFVNFILHLEPHRIIVSSRLIEGGYGALLEKTEDYTFDKRGDIGVVVRRAAIKSLQELTLHLLSIGTLTGMLNAERITCLLGRILQQAVSYNNSAREQAALAFYKLIVSDLLPIESLPSLLKEEIAGLFERYGVNDEFNWRDDSTPIFVSLLGRVEFSKDLWIGLIPAIGQESDLCAKQFRDALADYLLSLDDDDDDEGAPERPRQRLNALDTFLETLESLQSSGSRLATSGLIAADFLLSQGLMDGIDVEFQRRLLVFCWKARGSGADPKRVSAVVRLLNSMLQFDTDMYIIQ